MVSIGVLERLGGSNLRAVWIKLVVRTKAGSWSQIMCVVCFREVRCGEEEITQQKEDPDGECYSDCHNNRHWINQRLLSPLVQYSKWTHVKNLCNTNIWNQLLQSTWVYGYQAPFVPHRIHHHNLDILHCFNSLVGHDSMDNAPYVHIEIYGNSWHIAFYWWVKCLRMDDSWLMKHLNR